jgi:flagella basal body P-ring formation protein FlgA
MRNEWRRALLLAACAGLVCFPAQAANLRPYRALAGNIVRLSDLFDALGQTPDRDLGPAPAPGDRITVEAPQLAAIASDFGVAWRPRSGAERAVLERGGVPMDAQSILAPLRRALTQAGAPEDADIETPGFTPPTLPAGSTAKPDVGQVVYDAGSLHFSATLSVADAGMAAIHLRISGQILPVTGATVLTHHVRPGSKLRDEDLRTARLHANLLRGNAPLNRDAVLGMTLRHDVAPGQPITAPDLARPLLVTRTGAVRMRLDAGGLMLSAQGVALEDGGMGDRVRVQNPSSHAVVMAEVTGDGEVRVEPGRPPVVLATQ